MKKFLRILAVIIAVTLSTAVFSACSAFGNAFFKVFGGKAVESIGFADDGIEMVVGESKTVFIEAEPTDFNEKISFGSSDETVVKTESVEVGNMFSVKITALKAGTAKVTAVTSFTEKSAEMTVNVKYAEMTSLEISYTGELSQIVGGEITPIIFTAVPNAHASPDADFKWSVKEKNGAAVLKSGAGKSFAYTMSSEKAGVTYVVTVSVGNVSAEIECGLYQPMTDVGLATESEHKMGEESVFELTWGQGCNENPEIKWYCNGTLLEGENARTLRFMPEKHKEYEIYAEADGENSSVITFTPSYNVVQKVDAQVTDLRFEAGKPVRVTLTYDLSMVDPNSSVRLKVYRNKDDSDPCQTVEKKASEFILRKIEVYYAIGGEYELLIKLNDVQTTVKIEVDDNIPMVQNVSLSEESIEGGKRVSANVLPAGAGHFIKWYVNGIEQENEKTSTIDIVFEKKGEYHVRANVDNMYSAYLTLVNLTADADDAIKRCYADKEHYYGGYKQNYYITNQREMNNIIHYAIETRIENFDIYVDYDESVNVGEKLGKAFSAYTESGITPSYPNITDKQKGEVSICLNFTDASDVSPDRKTEKQKAATQNERVAPTGYDVGATPSSRTLYIDNPELPKMEVSCTNMLYKAVQWGFQPQIEDAPKVKAVFENAKSILKRIVNDEMNEYEKVLAIYEWLCYAVTYDQDLATMETPRPPDMASDEEYKKYDLKTKMKYDGYYLEGVFSDLSDSRAVCDGKSKAFVLLCGMEGIKSVRISGVAGGTDEKGGHAWNKVFIDADGNNIREWYFIDTTWGDVTVKSVDNTAEEVLNHDYFLAADDEMKTTHVEDPDKGFPSAVNDYDYFAQTYEYGGIVYDYRISNENELIVLFKYAKEQGLSSVEFVSEINNTALSGMIGKAKKQSGYNIGQSFYPLESGTVIVYTTA